MFESAEHRDVGNAIKLPGLNPDNILYLVNGLKVHFGDVLALAGDYFADTNHPICFAKEATERKKRFLTGYQLLTCANRKDMATMIKMIKKQRESIAKAMSEGLPESVGLMRYKRKQTLILFYLTKFNILKLYAMSFDHMGENSLIAYHTGHQLALESALRAHHLQDEKQKASALNEAYTLEAFACHFLTDRFSSGHLRVPQAELYVRFGIVASTILATLMHDEENYQGLYVENGHGDKWRTYGDAHLFEAYNETTKKMIVEALQLVVNDIADTYQTGKITHRGEMLAHKLLPIPSANNYHPMFMCSDEGKQIYYRANINDRNCGDYKLLTNTKVYCILASHYWHQIEKWLKPLCDKLSYLPLRFFNLPKIPMAQISMEQHKNMQHR